MARTSRTGKASNPIDKKIEKETEESRQVDAFARQVSAALDHCQNYLWLGENSPLSAPYLLGSRLDQSTGGKDEASASARGEALYKALVQAASQIEEDELRALVQDRYLKRNPYLSNTGHALRRSISERTFYRLRNRAIAALAVQLYGLLVPPLRLEAPIATLLAGRRAARATLAQALEAGSAVYISGASGMGKSTLAAHAVREDARALFWFTVRPGLNDHLASFVFALAYFLHERGAPHTWRQLIADSGRIGEERVLAMLRFDFSLLAQPVLLCVDDVDALRAESTDHGRLLYLLEGLPEIAAGMATLLLIGQRVVLRTPIHIALNGFDEAEVREWLAQRPIHALDDDRIRELMQVTQGSPLLLTLFATLLHSGDNADTLLATFAGAPSLEALLVRIWRRLDDAERTLLMRIAVFAEAAPADAWHTEARRIAQLAERGLLLRTASGELMLSSHLRSLIYERIPADLKRTLHTDASILREERGEVVRAMRHALAARAPDRALLLWLAHRQEQINRGSGTDALAVLSRIASTDLSSTALGTALQVVRAELQMLSGDAEEAEAGLRNAATTGNSRVDAYTKEILATALEAQGQSDHAARLYDEALEMLVRPLELSRVKLHNRMAVLYGMRQRDLPTARAHAFAARMEAEIYQGWVEEAIGNLSGARTHLESALEISTRFNCPAALLATLYSHLGMLLMHSGEPDEGIAYMQRAIAQSEVRGDMRGALVDRINVAWAMTTTNKAEEALAFALEGMTIALRMKNGYLIAGLSAAAGEAAVMAGHLEDGERYLIRSLQEEEEFFHPWALTALGTLRTKQTRYGEARKLLQEAIEESRAIEDLHGEAYALQALAASLRAADNPAAAHDAITRAHSIYVGLGMRREIEATAAMLVALAASEISNEP